MTATPSPDVAPQTVRNARLLYLVHGVIRLLGAVLALVLLPQTIDLAGQEAARQLQGQDTNGVDVDSIVTGAAIGGTVISVLFGVAVGVLTILFAGKLLRGRNWARIVLLVFTVLSLPGLASFGGPGGVAVGLLTVVGVLAAVAGAVLSFLPASNPWFRRSPAPPAGV